uniref:Fibronectin type-III domain-containing protein n=1 Tax=Pygocentrus nattereri TaxID=42514 RepID=A0AAR2LWM3_PYGNA
VQGLHCDLVAAKSLVSSPLSFCSSGSSFELPSPSNVTITCDSYGVMVSWTSSGLSENASFNLQLKSNNPHQYNISELLQDTGYNHYLVEVKARDGEYESPPADSKKFSFSYLQNADIQCNLAFPPVDLIPGERRLFFRFSNPLQLYRRTPALRSLTAAESLCYDVFDNRFECTSKTCEGNVSFPVEQEEYCVKLSGRIRQTRLEETKYLCYCGSLGPSEYIHKSINNSFADICGISQLLKNLGGSQFKRNFTLSINSQSLHVLHLQFAR